MRTPSKGPGARGRSVASLASELSLAPATFQVRLDHLLDQADAPAPWRRLGPVIDDIIADLFAARSS